MAKKALLDVLEQTIGKYVCNLDAESLNVAVWSGKIELNSLELDVVAVNSELDRQAAEAPNLAVPFRVVSGLFGNFTVDVPWANLMSKSVVLRAESLTVTVEPFDRTASVDFLSAVVESEGARAKKIIEQRLKSIALADDFRQRKNALRELAQQDLQSTSSNEQSNPTSTSFSARLVRRIIENIQIEINGVHVKILGSQGSAGVVLKSLQLVTTDQNGVRTFVDRTQPSKDGDQNVFLHKSLSISGLGLYLDDNDEQCTRLLAIGEVQDNFDSMSINDHSYVLAPLSFDASLRQADSIRCIDVPKYFLRSELSALSILLSQKQLALAQAISRQIRSSNNLSRPLFPEYRPLQRVSSTTAADWWKYALRCVRRLTGRRSWHEFFQAFQKRKRYIQLYKQFSHSHGHSWIQPLTDDGLKELEMLELDRSISVEGLMYWRNISDAQFKKEVQKHNSIHQNSNKTTKGTSIFTSLFGSSTVVSNNPELVSEPPISLTVSELKELEKVGQAVESELILDSQLYDVQFILGSFQVNLSSYGNRQLAALDMGTVSTSFKANTNGSFTFLFSLSSLTIDDKVTPNSYFPTILKNQVCNVINTEASEQVENVTSYQDAFKIQMHKTKDGHQTLLINLSTFQAIASPTFFREFKRFTNTSVSLPLAANNALLTQSLSGSVDLFYDAYDGGYTTEETMNIQPIEWNLDIGNRVGSDGQVRKDDISQKLIEAWKTKKETKATWTVDFDLQAPIVFVPESCFDPRANVLVFDLGHLKMHYGKMDSFSKVAKWFDDNPRGDATSSELILDHGSLRISSLAFTVGKVGGWQSLAHKHDDNASSDDDTVIEPVTLHLNFGVETRINEEIPRLCIFGILPSFSLRLSQDQLSRIISVGLAWARFLKDISPSEHIDLHMSSKPDISSTDSSENVSASKMASNNSATKKTEMETSGIENRSTFTKIYADMRLQKLSIKVLTDLKGGLEAHLVSVLASTSTNSDGTSIMRLSMGWFWILDGIDYDFQRQNRLIAHSKIPMPEKNSDSSVSEHSYNIMQRLESLGVFDDNYEGSAELANITYRCRSESKSFGHLNPFSSDQTEGNNFDVDAIIDAAFSSLHVNWNPFVIKQLSTLIGEFSNSLPSKTESAGEVVIVESVQTPRKQLRSDSSIRLLEEGKINTITGVTILKAKMHGLFLTLNSAKDDLPLFMLSMSKTSFNLVSGMASERRLSISLGELKIATPDMGKTDPLYRNILGLASTTHESLLRITYFSGKNMMAIASEKDNSLYDYEAFGQIELSPMRMVYIQAQVLALVEYFTAGILGALASQAASSAVYAAAEIARPADSKTKFRVRATHFNLLLPTAACKPTYLSLQLAALTVEYNATLQFGGKAVISLGGVTMQDSQDSTMLEVPVQMDLDVALPRDDIGTKEDQALCVSVIISNSPFTISKMQYLQIFDALAENIGAVDLFLRNDELTHDFTGISQLKNETVFSSEQLVGEISHSGVQIIDNPRWIFLQIDMKLLSLRICAEDADEPIILVSAVEAFIDIKMRSDEGKKSIKVTLKDLFCEDQRLKSLTRQHRSIIYQDKDKEKSTTNDHEAFVICYDTDIAKKHSAIDLTIGSPRFVLIPDVIFDVLAFLSQAKSPKPVSTTERVKAKEFEDVVEVRTSEGDSAVEAAVVQALKESMATTSFSMKTSSCAVIFVDLGTAAPMTRFSQLKKSIRSVSETVVVGGIFNAKLHLTSSEYDGRLMSLETEFHGEDIESYTAFGRDLHSTVQILEPAHVALFFDFKAQSVVSTNVDIRCAIMTPLVMTLSMRNIALVNAIVASMTINEDCSIEGNQVENETKRLSLIDTKRINDLTAVLEGDDYDDSQSSGIEVTHEGVTSDLVTISSTNEKYPGQVTSNFEEGDVTSIESTHVSISNRHLAFQLTTLELQMTFVNDLQGLDEALLRFSTNNFVANAKVIDGARIQDHLPTFTAFDFTVHTSLLADYFDTSSNSWKVLLLKPWELSLRGRRGQNERIPSTIPATTVDVESLACYVSFSEQFLMSLASANRMWAVYTAASLSTLNLLDKNTNLSTNLRKSIAASAARTFVVSLPYALANHIGTDMEILINGYREERRLYCIAGNIEYFRFEPPPGKKGSGGKRLYGQDVMFQKTVILCIFNSRVNLPHIDSLIGKSKQSHKLENGLIVFTQVVKDGKTITIYVSSGIAFHNRTSIPFNIGLVQGNQSFQVGLCEKVNHYSSSNFSQIGNISKSAKTLELPLELTRSFRDEWDEKGETKISVMFFPKVPNMMKGWKLSGGAKLNASKTSFAARIGEVLTTRFDVTCRPMALSETDSTSPPRDMASFVFQASVTMSLIDNITLVMDVAIEPRSVIKNKMPIGLNIKTPMPHVFSTTGRCEVDSNNFLHEIEPDEYVEVFTPGPSIAISMKTSSLPVGGTSTDWIFGGWVHLPLVTEFESIRCILPFVSGTDFCGKGSEIFIVEGSKGIEELVATTAREHEGNSEHVSIDSSKIEPIPPPIVNEEWRSFYITICNYAVDHTGSVLFEEVENFKRTSIRHNSRRQSLSHQASPALGAFATRKHLGRVSLLPGSSVPIRVLYLTMEGDEGLKRSSTFKLDDISIGAGGIEATPLKWEDGTISGFFAYRRLISSYQSELHVIPEYIVYNGSKSHTIHVHCPGFCEVEIPCGKFAPITTNSNDAVVIFIEYPDLDGRTPMVRINSFGLRIAVVKHSDGTPIARVALQTVVGHLDSRLVVKVGDVSRGAEQSIERDTEHKYGMTQNDFFRVRLRWSELVVTLNEARPIVGSRNAVMEAALDKLKMALSPPKPINDSQENNQTWMLARQGKESGKVSSFANDLSIAVCTVRFHRFTVDWQRIFKEETTNQHWSTRILQSPERSQLSVVIHHVQILDDNPMSPFPIVFDSTSKASFFDLCVRTRGSTSADLVQVDLISLNLAHSDGVSQKIYISTSEDFVWKLLDVFNRIVEAAAEFAGVDIQMQWCDEEGCFNVSIRDKDWDCSDPEHTYTPPKSDKLYHIRKTKVSPFTTVVSFRRNPQASRYKLFKQGQGANIMNYFTRRLKFKIDMAELSFARYEANNVKGPLDRIIEVLSTVYLSRAKTKFVTILSAASFQDWKYLASRECGDDEFMEGDLVRVTGNLAGKTAGYVLKQAGQGLGGGVSSAASTVGHGIEIATAQIGARALGAGVNSVVSGVGDGFGDAVSGVGAGAGKVLQGAGMGVGHVFGGITGGAQIMTKGIGKAITTGDGRAATSGIVRGAAAVGTGVGQGVESVVVGTAEGVFSAGKGLFSGVKNVGRGIGDAFLECCSFKCCSGKSRCRHENALSDPLLPS